MARRGVDGCDTRREEGTANDFVPVEAQTGFDEQAGGDEPSVLEIGSDFEIVEAEWSLSGEDALAKQSTVFAQIVDRGTGDVFVGADVIEFDSGFEIVTTGPVARRQVERGCEFLAL